MSLQGSAEAFLFPGQRDKDKSAKELRGRRKARECRNHRNQWQAADGKEIMNTGQKTQI